MKKLKLITVTVLIAFVAACSTTPNKAPVVEQGVESVNTDTSKSTTVVTKPPVKPVDPRSTYVVKRGDTLFRIALDHGQSYSDIVSWNSLKNPNDIKVDQVLRVSPPDGSSQVQTASVSPSSVVETRPLPQINSATNKSSPRGDKRLYSESNLTELQKTDAVAAGSVATLVVKPENVVPVKLTEKHVEMAASESETVDWMWPAEGKVTQYDDVKNKGLDISGKLGQDVLAAGAGKVMYAGSGIRGYGNLVIIKHTNNLLSAYAHNKAILVKEGQSIARGQKIAEMGNSDSDTVKLHFEIRQQGKPVDPGKFLPRQ